MKEGSGAMPVLFLMAFLCALVQSYILAIIINHFAPFSLMRGAMVGTICWVGFAAPTSFATAIFSMTKEAALADQLGLQPCLVHRSGDHSVGLAVRVN